MQFEKQEICLFIQSSSVQVFCSHILQREPLRAHHVLDTPLEINKCKNKSMASENSH